MEVKTWKEDYTTYGLPVSGLCMNFFAIDFDNFSINPCQPWIFNPNMRTDYYIDWGNLQDIKIGSVRYRDINNFTEATVLILIEGNYN